MTRQRLQPTQAVPDRRQPDTTVSMAGQHKENNVPTLRCACEGRWLEQRIRQRGLTWLEPGDALRPAINASPQPCARVA